MKKGLLAIGLSMVAAHVFGQMPVAGVHYPAGLNGSKAGIPAAPGIYFQDDNWIFTANANQSASVSTFTLVYVQAPQLTWLTDWKVLGANVGADVMVPLIYREDSKSFHLNLPSSNRLTVTMASDRFGVGDIKIEPLLLAWHWEQCDLMTAYAVWAPSGHFSAGSLDNLGDNEWTHMISLGAVWYPDEEKTWAVSILHHYEINSSQVGPAYGGVAPGGGYELVEYRKIACSTYTLECAVSKTIFDHTDVGLTAYYQQQFSADSSAANPNANSDVAGVGPEISALIPGWNLLASLRYAYEFTAYDRPQGHTVDLSLTKKF